MAFADSGANAAYVSGVGPPLRVTASGTWAKGDLIGISSNTYVRADSDGGIFAEFVAGAPAVSGSTGVPLYRAALVWGNSRFTGGTAGAPLYLSDTAGECDESAGTTAQHVGFVGHDGVSVFLCPVRASGGQLMLGPLDMNAKLITNIGAGGTDFSATGGLTLADGLTVTAGGITVTAGDTIITDGDGLVIGGTAQLTLNALVPELQVQGTTVGVDGAIATVLYSSTAAEGPEIILARSKGATLGTNTIVASGDSLGRIVAMGADGSTGFDPAAAIVFEVAGTPGASADMPGRIVFQTSPDGSQTPATRFTVLSGATTVAQAQLGTAGTSTGALLFGGVTSGVVTLTVAAAAGTWTMQLPAAVGSAGQQLTDAAGDGVTTWAAASLGEWKNDLGILDPHEALAAVVKAPTHRFTYNADVMPVGQWAPKDIMTGIFAEEAPWAMHGERDGLRSGIAFSTINAFGYARAAIQALHEDLQGALNEIAGLTTQLTALKPRKA